MPEFEEMVKEEDAIFERGYYYVVPLIKLVAGLNTGLYGVVNKITGVVEYSDAQLMACIDGAIQMDAMLKEKENKEVFRLDIKLET